MHGTHTVMMSRNMSSAVPPLHSQVVCLREVFPYSAGIVLAFEYMPTDLASVLRDSERRLSEVCTGWGVDG